MQTVLTVIVDNIPSGNLQGEWGLSILAEHRGKRILVDAGASELFAQNLAKLGYDIQNVDLAVLSHAHYDHAGGMDRFFRDNAKADFYIRDTAGEDCYSRKLFLRKYIGIPRKTLSSWADRIVPVSGDLQVSDGAWLIPHRTPGLERIGRREKMFRRTAGGWQPDDFSHEQSLVLETQRGLVIVNSCSHGGAVNIIREVMDVFPGKHVHALIGGFHLFNKSEKEIRAVSQAIRETGIDFVCTGHCTKDRACGIMKEELGDRLEQLRAGLRLEF